MERRGEDLDRIEALRRRGRIREALDAVDEVLEETPGQRRALLLKSRLLYQNGSAAGALDALRQIEPLLGEGEVSPLKAALMQLENDARRSPAFATESMARLLIQQGYLLEAAEVYRQLFEDAQNRDAVRDEIVRLVGIIAQEGSRDAAEERVQRELETCERWLEEHPRGS